MLRTRPGWALVLGACALLLATASAAQNDSLQTKRATDLRQSPADSATAVANLPAQSVLTRMAERQGPWLRVKTASGQMGWVHMFDVGSPQTQPDSGNAAGGALRGLSGLLGRATGTPSTTTATSTIGIRGLGAEDIANAQPNVRAIGQMEALRVDDAQARRFAADAKWASQTVEPLPAPPPPNAPAGGNASPAMGGTNSGR